MLLMAVCVALFVAACSNSKKADTANENTTNEQIPEKVMYQCPMDLEVVQDKPGTCPKCGMDLEKIVIRGNDTIRTQ